jgi:hypothetical protein
MPRLQVLLAVVLIAAVPWLAGCSGGGDNASAEPSKVTESRPGVTDDLPAGFPKDQIPLIDAEVTTALETEEGYHVTVEPTTSYAKAFKAALKRLKGAGFTVKYNQKLGTVRTAKLASKTYTAVLSGGEGGVGGKTSLTYLIEKLV